MNILCYYLCVLVVFVGAVSGRKLPPYVNRCYRSDPNLDQCILKAVAVLQPKFEAGIPEMHLPPLNPLRIPSITLELGNQFTASFNNIEVYGLHKFEIKKSHFDIEKNTCELSIFVENLRIKAVYNVDGRILILDLKGKGNGDGNYTNVQGDAFVKGYRKFIKGKEHILFDKIDLEIQVGGAHFEFGDLFNGNQELTDNTNRIINENALLLIEEFKPVIKDSISQFILNTVRDVFTRYTVDELFL